MTARLKENWFWPVALVLMAMAWMIASSLPGQLLAGWEMAVVFDVVITLPILFLLCYRTKLARNALIIRIIGLQCVGIWLATKIVPLDQQIVLPHLSWLRWIGLGVLLLIELRILITLFQIVFKANTTTRQLEDMGMPPFLAKLALLEARFWRWVFGVFWK